MEIKKLFGKKLQEIRKSKKLTQEQIAEIVGVETSSISNIENGKYFPSVENLEKIIKALDVNISDLFCFNDLASTEELINEMVNSMKNNENLTRTMYKFYSSIKFRI